MKRIHLFIRAVWVAVALANSIGVAHAGTACNRTPVAPQSSEAFGRDMIVNGVPTSLVGMQFAGTADDVSNAFREFWTREDVPARGKADTSGLLLSALDGNCLYVLSIPRQPKAASTRGLMSVIRLGDENVDHRIADASIPLPEESKVLSDIESRDPGQTGRTWLLDIPGEARWNAQRYHNSLAIRGWVDAGQRPDYQSAGLPGTRGTAFAMQHGSNSLDVSFTNRDGRTAAVIHATRNR
jgi:hypothetical protein